jgi:hypothetical protein
MKQILSLFSVFLVMGSVAPAGRADDKIPLLSNIQADLYGYVKLDASYNTQRSLAGDLMFYVLPEGEDGRKREFHMTARETRLGLNLSVPGETAYHASGKLEIDFYGSGGSDNSPLPRMRLAYATLTRNDFSLMAGQDWDTLIAMGPGYVILPRIVNFSYLADAGALGLRRPQIRLTWDRANTDGPRLIAKIAASRTIGQDLDGDGHNDGAAAGLPTAQGNLILVAHPFGARKTILSLAGHAGSERCAAYTEEALADAAPLTVPQQDYDTWSLIGNFSQQLASKLTLQGSIWTGENLDSYFGGIGQGVNRDLRRGVRAQGGWGQLAMDATEKLGLHIGYGLDRPESDDLNVGDRARNEVYFASVFYKAHPAATLALEVSRMTTDYKGGDDAQNQRAQGSLALSF